LNIDSKQKRTNRCIGIKTERIGKKNTKRTKLRRFLKHIERRENKNVLNVFKADWHKNTICLQKMAIKFLITHLTSLFYSDFTTMQKVFFQSTVKDG
jgi:hypothetical protein